jgi:hypothetical protein
MLSPIPGRRLALASQVIFRASTDQGQARLAQVA